MIRFLNLSLIREKFAPDGRDRTTQTSILNCGLSEAEALRDCFYLYILILYGDTLNEASLHSTILNSSI